MKILVYGINYSPELTGIGKYTGEMVEWLAAQGHEVRVITAPPYYPQWQVGENYSAWRYKREEGAATVWRCPLYVPKQPSTLKRLLHLGSFAVSSFFPLMAQRRWKPDRIIGVVPTLFCTPGMRLLAKLSGARTVLHIQDYEVDAMLGLGLAGKGKGGKVAQLATAFERSGLHNVDNVSTISRSMMNKAIEKGVAADNVIFFPNWSEIARFQHVADADVDALRNQLGLPDNKKIILYSGNIGEKQGLENVIEAADLLRDEPLIFAIVGQGGGKARLEKMAQQRGLRNMQFFPLQSYDALPALLKMGDCHLVVQKRGAADAVLPSKLTNILAVGGNAVITAEAHTELGQLCETFPGIAVCVEPESVEALVAGIRQALLLPKHNTPDGNFPNGIPNPLLPECRDDTRNAVIKHGADMGIAFDGDFDRCFLFDEKGQFIEGYYIVGLLAEAFLEKNPGAKIIHDPRLSWNTIDVVTAAGGTPVMSKTGHAFIKERMRKEDAIYGGEMSAHHYFRDFAYCDSGMIPWLLVAELVCLKGKTLGELVRDRMAAFPASGEINSKLAQPVEAINRVEQHFSREALAVDRSDGISMTFADWRFNLRTSNTEPVVRLNVESRGDVPLMEARTRTLLTLLNE
ncbi:colanic acid biosynthesis glycosyltransferase WcaI [Escherichia coli]